MSGPPHCQGFTITLRHATRGRTFLDEWSNTLKRQTSMTPAGFEPAIPASERPQTHALESAATGTGLEIFTAIKWPERSYEKYLVGQLEPNSAAKCIIVVDSSPYQNTALHKASLPSSEEMDSESDCWKKKIHLTRKQQSIFFRGFVYSLLNYFDNLRALWCQSAAHSRWRFRRARSTTQDAASADLSYSVGTPDIRLVQKELRLYFSWYSELFVVSCLNYDSKVWRICWYSIQIRRKWKWGCWITRTANGRSAVGRHCAVNESAVLSMKEIRMRREETLRRLLHPVQNFLLEIVVTPS